MSNVSLRGQAAQGGAITLVTQAVRVVIQLSSVVILARFIAPEFFGLLAMVLAITGMAEIFRDFGLSQSALRRTDLTHQQRSNLFWLNMASGLALAVAIYCLSWAIAAFYGNEQLVTIVQWIAPVYFVGGLATQFRVHINTELRFKALAVIDILSPLLAVCAAVVLAVQGYAVPALIALQVIGPVVVLILSILLARWWPSLPRRAEGMKELLTFGVSFAFTQLLSYATRNVDSIAIGRVWGAGPLGIYDRAYQFSVAPLVQINAPMSRVAIPVLARVIDDRPRYIRSLREAQLIQTYLTATVLLVAAGLGTPLMVLLLGEKWVASGVIFTLLAVGSVFRSIQQIAYWMYMTLGLAGAQLKLYLVGQPVILLCILAGLSWGPVGVAAGSTIGWVIFWMMSLLWVGRVSRIRVRSLMLDPLRVIGVVGLPAGALAFAVATWVATEPLWGVLFGLAVALSWILFVTLVAPWVRRDVRTLIRFARMAVGKGR